MYIYLDQPVGRLENGERFLLWAMRGWSHAIEKNLCPPMALCRGFTAINAIAALPDFHARVVDHHKAVFPQSAANAAHGLINSHS